MKILLVDNNTKHLRKLNKTLAGHDVEIQLYQPGIDFHYQDKDLIILSGGGGEGLEIDDVSRQGKLWYDDEMAFIRGCPKPILGICMGFEVMAAAYGQAVPQLNKKIGKTARVYATPEGYELFGRQEFKQIEFHQWHVPKAPKGFKSLLESEYGVEMIMAKNRLGVQFHPELGGTLNLKQLISSV